MFKIIIYLLLDAVNFMFIVVAIWFSRTSFELSRECEELNHFSRISYKFLSDVYISFQIRSMPVYRCEPTETSWNLILKSVALT